jgi:hypothetical protein
MVKNQCSTTTMPKSYKTISKLWIYCQDGKLSAFKARLKLSSEEVCGKFRHILSVVTFQCGWKPFGVFVVSFRVVGSHFVFDTCWGRGLFVTSGFGYVSKVRSYGFVIRHIDLLLNGEEPRQVLGSVVSLMTNILNEPVQENFRIETSI